MNGHEGCYHFGISGTKPFGAAESKSRGLLDTGARRMARLNIAELEFWADVLQNSQAWR